MHGLENTNRWSWKDGYISSWQRGKNNVLMLLFTHVTITYDAKKTIFKISKKVIQIHKICVYFLKRNVSWK